MAVVPLQTRSMREVMDRLETEGFRETFVLKGQMLYVPSLNRYYAPAELTIHGASRFEGESNPEDMSVIYRIEAIDGVRGTLVDAFGVYSDPALGELLQSIGYDQQEAFREQQRDGAD